MSTIARLAALTRARVSGRSQEDGENNAEEGARSIRSFAFLSQLLAFNRNRDDSREPSDRAADNSNQEERNSERET